MERPMGRGLRKQQRVCSCIGANRMPPLSEAGVRCTAQHPTHHPAQPDQTPQLPHSPACSAAEGLRGASSPLPIRSKSLPSGRCSLFLAASIRRPSPLLCGSPSSTRLCARCRALRRSASRRLAASLGLSGTLQGEDAIQHGDRVRAVARGQQRMGRTAGRTDHPQCSSCRPAMLYSIFNAVRLHPQQAPPAATFT